MDKSFTDAGNPLLAPGPSQLDLGTVDSPQGKIGIATIRTASTTLTVVLNGPELDKWAELFGQLAKEVKGTGLVTATVAETMHLSKG